MTLVAERTTEQGWRRVQPWGIGVLLVAATLAVYWPVLSCDFTNFDDPDYFTANVHVLTGLRWSNVTWAFGTGHAANWHPMTWLSLMLDAELFGRGPFGPHLTNLALHAANTVLLYLLLRRLTGRLWSSALVAGLFALHPLHVESVAWVAERKDVLSTMFFLLTLWAYAEYAKGKREVRRPKSEGSAKSEVRSPKSIVHGPQSTVSRCGCAVQSSKFKVQGSRFPSLFYYLLALFLFALGLMSKPMLVTLPFVLLLLDFWPLQRLGLRQVEEGTPTERLGLRTSDLGLRTSLWSLGCEKLPFFVLSAVSCVVTFLAQQRGGAVRSLAVPWAGRIENAFVAYACYLGKTFWPANLAVLYPHPIHWGMGRFALSLVLVVGLCAGAVRLGRKHPYVPAGWFWFLGTLIPVIGFIQVGTQSLADRYTYLPLIGVFIIMVWGVGEGLKNRVLPAAVFFLLAGVLLAACAAATRVQLSYWQDSESLFRHALAATRDNWVAHENLGTALSDKGRQNEAVECFNDALRIRPEEPGLLYNLGSVFSKLGDRDRALDYFNRSLRIQPKNADAWYNLGNLYAKQGDWEAAIPNYRRALGLAPDQTDILNNLGFALAARQQFSEAITNFEAALRLDADYADAHNNLGTVLFRLGRLEEAGQHFRQAVRVMPDNPQAHANLADVLVRQGRIEEAVWNYREALRLNPSDARSQAKLQALSAHGSN